jgi:hypothetical protein
MTQHRLLGSHWPMAADGLFMVTTTFPVLRIFMNQLQLQLMKLMKRCIDLLKKAPLNSEPCGLLEFSLYYYFYIK